LLWISKQRR